MSIITQPEASTSGEVKVIREKKVTKKILEEEEYLGRMSHIIRRDYFPNIQLPEVSDTHPSDYNKSDRSSRTYNTTPATDRTQSSTTSTMRSRKNACSLSLSKFLDKYTSEDNAYFEKLQRKDLRRHRHKYPWLYKDKGGNNQSVQHQLNLPATQGQNAIEGQDSSVKMIGWTHNPRNTLFYAPESHKSSTKPQSTINYHSNQYLNESLFKEPLPPSNIPKVKPVRGSNDKIGIDGKPMNSTPTPIVHSFPPLLPVTEVLTKAIVEEPKCSANTNKFYIAQESPRDELAHKLYEDKVAKVIRTPRTGTRGTPRLNTPSVHKPFSDFSFSPERVKKSRN